jgi:hypothetical protein
MAYASASCISTERLAYSTPQTTGKTVKNLGEHRATAHGTQLVRSVRSLSFPACQLCKFVANC